MLSCNTYSLTWVSLPLDMGYLFRVVPAKRSHCSLPLDKEYLLTTAPPDLESGVAPLGPPAPMQPQPLGRGVAPLGRCPWPRVWDSSPPAAAPGLGRGCGGGAPGHSLYHSGLFPPLDDEVWRKSQSLMF